MAKRILLLLCVSLAGKHLLAQCNSCDSQMIAKGYHFLTPEEKKKDPKRERKAVTYRCDPNCGLIITPPPRPLFKFDGKWGYISLRTGVNYEQLKVSGFYISGLRYNHPRQKYLSVAFDLDAPEWSGIVIRAELAWKPQSFEGTEETKDAALCRWQVSTNTIGQEISMLYKSTEGVIRWFVGAGVGRDRMMIKQNTWTDYLNGKFRTVEDDVRLSRAHWFTALSAGVMVRDRIELRCKRIGTQWSSELQMYNIKNKGNVISVGYRFL
jgi:hypothetical protein